MNISIIIDEGNIKMRAPDRWSDCPDPGL